MIGASLLPMVESFVAILITGSKMDKEWYDSLKHPYLEPPSCYLVYKSGGNKLDIPVKVALLAYFVQLLVNWSWSPIFFGYKQISLAYYTIVILWSGILTTMIAFFRICHPAGVLFVPYLIWTSFAAYLNYSFMVLNDSKFVEITI
ncbi:TSPO [Lepeophtheirus salmonis]|uniref:TSPO n=1 Tax=Lepeophtheirus salmonis TaxID=72036 RepID=A0A7R8D2R1_LEPSM|nr:TSPO [Lepeophtheirus salmonis]CAF3007680.1 TSPO [Lepeophtheirus salmonis]